MESIVSGERRADGSERPQDVRETARNRSWAGWYRAPTTPRIASRFTKKKVSHRSYLLAFRNWGLRHARLLVWLGKKKRYPPPRSIFPFSPRRGSPCWRGSLRTRRDICQYDVLSACLKESLLEATGVETRRLSHAGRNRRETFSGGR